MIERIEQSSREVATPMTFSTLIIGVAFLPLFTMTGVSGVIFAPMARTYAFAIGGAICLALTLTPVLASKFVPAQVRGEGESHHARPPQGLRSGLRPRDAVPQGRAGVQHGRPSRSAWSSSRCSAASSCRKLEEGNFWIRATLPMSISLDQSAKYVGRMRRILRGCPEDEARRATTRHRKYPEVVTVVSQLGRPDDGTDVSGFYNIEFFAPLEAVRRVAARLTKDKLTEQISERDAPRPSRASSSTSRSTSRTTSRRRSAA